MVVVVLVVVVVQSSPSMADDVRPQDHGLSLFISLNFYLTPA